MTRRSVPGEIRRFVDRIQSDCRVSSYERAYNAFLEAAGRNGYDLISLINGLERFRGAKPTRPCLAIRHDVDINNVVGNQTFFKVELAHRATATYYFRLSTAMAHRTFINRLLQSGFEVGYHFEEAADLAKERQLRTREDVFRCRGEIQERFMRNCERFRKQYNPHLKSVSSHGDWINRHLKFMNNELLDESLLAQCGLDFEAYDGTFKGYFNLYLSDVTLPPERWIGDNDWIDRLKGVSGSVYTLAHERQWFPAPLIKMEANLTRLVESIRYHIPILRHNKNETRC